MSVDFAIQMKLEEIYSRIAALKCKRKCQEACGPILMESVEWKRLKSAGPVPDLRDMNCPLLQGSDCSRYGLRPAICRLWGVVKAMRCPHGCKPKRWMTDAEAHGILRQVRELSDGQIAGPALTIIGSAK